MINKFYKILILLIFVSTTVFAQLELVPASNPVYDFLKKMQLEGVIPEYNSSMTPITRSDVSMYLKKVEGANKLSRTDRKILEDFKIEFEFELNNSLRNSTALTKKIDTKSFFGNKTQKYIYNYADSNATLFLDFSGDIGFKSRNSDNGDNSVLLGISGLNVRGTLYNKIGYSIGYSGGKKIFGNTSDIKFAIEKEPKLKTNTEFGDGHNYFDFFDGYFRYQTTNDWLSLTLGRQAINCGFGYIDKLFLSNNTVPIDFLKLDLKYKKIRYTFLYGSLKGDSLGVDLDSKNIAFHRLNVKFSDKFKMGYYETVIMSNNPFSFVYFNPISFITSADLNTGAVESKKNNTLMGIDFEINPVRNLSLQGTLLIDDINFSTMFNSDSSSNDNKIGYQLGSMWTNAFNISNVSLILEYTRLNPFVYSHRSNKDSYTNWDLSLGHALPPNSDEIAMKLIYNITNRLSVSLQYQFQRSAQGIYYDSVLQKVVNYGGNINRGDGDYIINNKFLLGDRINRNIFTVFLYFEPIKQYIIELRYRYMYENFIYLSKIDKESLLFVNFRVNI